MALIDTMKAAELFAKYRVPLSGYVVNRVIPEELAQERIPDYLRNRLEMQKKHLQQIDELFGDSCSERPPPSPPPRPPLRKEVCHDPAFHA